MTNSTAACDTRNRQSIGINNSLALSNGFRDTHQLDRELLGKVNLSQLIREKNVLENDGLEDLHFNFVSCQQHKRLIMQSQNKQKK